MWGIACAVLLSACGSAQRGEVVRAPRTDPAASVGSTVPSAPADAPGGTAALPPGAADAQPVLRPLPGVAPAGLGGPAGAPAPSGAGAGARASASASASAGAGASASAATATAQERPPVPRPPRYVKLPAPGAVRSFDALQLQVARRLVEAHPDTSFTQTAPPRLLAIPVIEIELNQDGSVRNTRVLRHPSTGPEATQLALAAIRRAAPYGSVAALPRPWKVVEAFLFDDDMRFKPRTLDLD